MKERGTGGAMENMMMFMNLKICFSASLTKLHICDILVLYRAGIAAGDQMEVQ